MNLSSIVLFGKGYLVWNPFDQSGVFIRRQSLFEKTTRTTTIRNRRSEMKFSTKRFQVGAISWVMLFAISMILAGCGTSPSTQATGGYILSDSISVSGYGEAAGKPDIVLMQLGVNVVADQIGDAIDESNQAMDKITQALLGAGIAEEDLQTTNFNVWPEDRYDPMTGQSTGERVFHVDSTLQVKVRDIDKAPSLIEIALEQGANNIYGLTYDIDDKTALEAEARSKALQDAQVRADQLAAEIGVSLGDPMLVSEGYSGGAIYPVAYERAVGLGGGPPISTGQLTVSVQVNVTYAIAR
jgi:uncharacterized protein YggE